MVPGVERAIMQLAEMVFPLVREIKQLNKHMKEALESKPDPPEDLSLLYAVEPPMKINPATLQTSGKEQPLHRLQGAIYINGIPHHLDLIEVTIDDQGCQEAASSAMRKSFASLCEAVTPEGQFTTIEYLDRDYVVSIYPYTQ